MDSCRTALFVPALVCFSAAPLIMLTRRPRHRRAG